MRSNPWTLLIAATISILASLATPASADYDMSGRWLAYITDGAAPGPQPRQYDIQQIAGEILLTSWGASTSFTQAGMIDVSTGIFRLYISSSGYPFCGTSSATGSVAADGKTFTSEYYSHVVVFVPGYEPHGGHFECSSNSVLIYSLFGTRCGNEQIDDGEVCDDGNANDGDCCTASCTLGADGSACSDIYGCATGTCAGGACVTSTPAAQGKACTSETNLCIEDVCDGAGGCGGSTPAAAGTYCEADTDPCTSDNCDGSGTCLHPFNTAPCHSDDDPCTTDICDGAGNCSHPFNTAPCTDDGNPCTTDICDGAGTCTHPFNTAPCTSDGDVCTTDICDGAGVCGHVLNAAPCASDDNPCTTDVCSAGSCTHVDNDFSCDVACGSGTCSGGSCVVDQPSPLGTPCDPESACTLATCDGAGHCSASDAVGCGPCATCNGVSCVADSGDCDTAAEQISVTLNSDPADGSSARLKISIKEALNAADIGDPTLGTSYTLCLNRPDVAGVLRNVAAMTVAAGGTCGSADCWTPTTRGFGYKDSANASDGISSLRLDQAKGIKISGKGPGLPMSQGSLVDVESITPRLVASDGVTTRCWSHEVPADVYSEKKFRGKYSAD